MVSLAFWPGIAGVGLALLLGGFAAGFGVGASAALGIAVVLASFMTAGLSVSWAAGISFRAFQLVALVGFLVRVGAVVAVLAFLSHLAWVSDRALEFGAVPALILFVGAESLLVFKTRVGKPNLRLDGSGPVPSEVSR